MRALIWHITVPGLKRQVSVSLCSGISIRQSEWQKVPFGTHHWLSFTITTLAVTFIHNRPDWPAAFVWGALMYWLAVRTKSLGACLVMHAVGNLILGIYVLQTRQWGFW